MLLDIVFSFLVLLVGWFEDDRWRKIPPWRIFPMTMKLAQDVKTLDRLELGEADFVHSIEYLSLARFGEELSRRK
jgi:hypothetical protein